MEHKHLVCVYVRTTPSLILVWKFLIGNNFQRTNWSVNSFTVQSMYVCVYFCLFVCLFIALVLLLLPSLLLLVRMPFSVPFDLYIRIELVILKSYWFAYHANNAFFVQNDANATTPIETVSIWNLKQWTNSVVWPFFSSIWTVWHIGKNK